MELRTIKKLVIVAEAAIKTDILGLIEEMKVQGYTLYEVRGRGERGLRDYEATPLEYFKNIKFEILVSEEVAKGLLRSVMERFFEDYAVIAYLEDVQILREEKFGRRRD